MVYFRLIWFILAIFLPSLVHVEDMDHSKFVGVAQIIDIYPPCPPFIDTVGFEHFCGLAVVEERISIFKHLRNDFFLVVVIILI